MREIKTISCHGTSYTEGGGFEWHKEYKKNELNLFYSEIPKTEYNYSWPGQFQKLVKSKVTNYGKSGYGNQKIYRDVHDIFRNPNISNKTHLFLIEISQIGRTELFINELDDYCVINYDIKEDKKYYEFQGSANEYFKDSQDVQDVLDKKINFFKEYIETTKNYKVVLNEIERNLDLFISFLEFNNLNYCFVNTPLILFNIKPDNSKVIRYPSLNKKRILTDFVDYISENKLTITDDTNGKIVDPHFGLNGNRNIAKEIYEQLKENYKL